MDDLRTLIEGSDLNGLVRRIDGLVAAREWDGLVELRDACIEAVERGKQLWGVAQFTEYRLALDAPATRPAMSTNSIVAGTISWGCTMSAIFCSRRSGTGTTPTLGLMVLNG